MNAEIATPAKTHMKTVATVPVRVAKMLAIAPARIPTAMRRSLFTFQEGTAAMPVIAVHMADSLEKSRAQKSDLSLTEPLT